MGFLDSVFGENDKEQFKVAPEYPEATEARKDLSAISKGPLPKVPLREISPLQPLGEERQLARSTATEMAKPVDIFSLPEVQGIIQKATEEGNLLANRLGRSLQSSGNITSTTGRDVLGRAVSDVQGNLSASLANFASQERDRRANLIPVLEGLGFTREQNLRSVDQAGLDAMFQKETTESNQIQNFLVPILESVMTQKPTAQLATEPGRPGLIEQFSAGGKFLAMAGVGGLSGFNPPPA